MSFSILRLEYTKNLKCCVADWNGERGFSKRERREIRLSFNAGLSYSQRDGVSANAGVGIGLGGKKPTGSL
uniref:hypothetical protein n=1 Tax=Leptospira noguchii TaxID=28182 RepID=UPI000A44BC47